MTLLVALAVLSSVMIGGGALLTRTMSNSNHAAYSADTVVAQNVAESGMNYARSVLFNAADPTDPNSVGSGTIQLESGTATYAGTLVGDVWTLTGTGAAPNSAGGLPITETASSQVQVSSTATAGGPPLAIFAADADCGLGAFDARGLDTTIAGEIRSNGDFVAKGHNFSSARATGYGAPCDVTITGANPQLQTASPSGNIDQLIEDPTAWAWPVSYSESDFACTYSSDVFEFKTHGALIPAGVYCATDEFSLDGNNMSGTITVIAPNIEVKGEGIILAPFVDDVLFFASGTQDMKLDGFGYTWAGTIYHPNGLVLIAGNYASHLAGMIVARKVTLKGAGFTMTGVEPTSGLESDTATLENLAGTYITG